jgi:hypothetical protein
MATQVEVPNITNNTLSEEYWTEQQFAQFVRKTVRTVRSWQQQRCGPARIACGKTILYRRSAIEAWLRARESRPCRQPRARRARRTEAA